MSTRRGPSGFDRREFLAYTAAGAAGLLLPDWLRAQTAPSPGAAAGAKPNIIIIVADDLGYADIGVHGCKDIPTPNIDSIAANGVRCASGYVTCPVCSPTRAGLLTGRYQQRFGHEHNPAGQVSDFGLPLSETLLPKVLGGAGYATGMVGKWHLGEREGYWPNDRGFAEFFGFLTGGRTYLPNPAAPPIYRNREVVKEAEYLTDAFTREAVAFIDRRQKQPFFLYLTYNAVHTPMNAHPKSWARLEHIENRRRKTYGSMLLAMDDGIGAVLKKLRDAGIEPDTLVFFISDNGGPIREGSVNGSSNAPLREGKTWLYEGGVRVPYLVQWPARLAAGKVYDQPVSSLDIFATALAAAGAQPPDKPLDGADLLPHLAGQLVTAERAVAGLVTAKRAVAGKNQPPHEMLFWRYGPFKAVRCGPLKLVRQGKGPELFDVVKDPGEQTNLAAQRPDDVKRLDEALAQWEKGLVKPLWPLAPGAAPTQPTSRPQTQPARA